MEYKTVKYVKFDNKPKVRYMFAWDFAYRSCRRKYWEFFAIDRMHFAYKIKKFENVINTILDINHRNKNIKRMLTLKYGLH